MSAAPSVRGALLALNVLIYLVLYRLKQSETNLVLCTLETPKGAAASISSAGGGAAVGTATAGTPPATNISTTTKSSTLAAVHLPAESTKAPAIGGAAAPTLIEQEKNAALQEATTTTAAPAVAAGIPLRDAATAAPRFNITFSQASKEFVPCTRASQSQSSRPGTPCMPPAKRYPYKSWTPWRAELGERILAAVTPEGAEALEKKCNGWTLFGDSTWCNKAVKPENWSGVPGTAVGLSFGVEERDLWSEKMSNWFKVPLVQLFDCFQDPGKSPALTGRANPPADTGECNDNGPHCYSGRYEGYQVCLSEPARDAITKVKKIEPGTSLNSTGIYQFVQGDESRELDRWRRNYTTLSNVLEHWRQRPPVAVPTKSVNTPAVVEQPSAAAGKNDSNPPGSKPKLSVFLKIDVEGSEWGVLEKLAAPEHEMDRNLIRTLDMEVHFGSNTDPRKKEFGNNAKGGISFEVSILERLRKYFYVTGSTLEVYREGWHPDKDCPQSNCDEPMLHLAGGMGMAAFAVSYVNKALVDGS
ncbi:unnamed protein product [Amoebophrya sp. A120]|nr:unnamed protein product [Amoebophrya sp. A120]|eukprot:GSA120T00025237001.1